MFTSRAKSLGIVGLPAFSGIRVMMMPFHIADPTGSLPPELDAWKPVVESMLFKSGDWATGTGYLTIDEALVKAGETHRRPGRHVDGVGPNGEHGSWGGGGGYGANGMLMVTNHPGVRIYQGTFRQNPEPNGDCSHVPTYEVSGTFGVTSTHIPEAGEVWYCESLCMHEALPMVLDTKRQFCRISFPSRSPWYEGYTENPLGIKPDGPIHPPRVDFMAYRP